MREFVFYFVILFGIMLGGYGALRSQSTTPSTRKLLKEVALGGVRSSQFEQAAHELKNAMQVSAAIGANGEKTVNPQLTHNVAINELLEKRLKGWDSSARFQKIEKAWGEPANENEARFLLLLKMTDYSGTAFESDLLSLEKAYHLWMHEHEQESVEVLQKASTVFSLDDFLKERTVTILLMSEFKEFNSSAMKLLDNDLSQLLNMQIADLDRLYYFVSAHEVYMREYALDEASGKKLAQGLTTQMSGYIKNVNFQRAIWSQFQKYFGVPDGQADSAASSH